MIFLTVDNKLNYLFDLVVKLHNIFLTDYYYYLNYIYLYILTICILNKNNVYNFQNKYLALPKSQRWPLIYTL